MSSHILADLKTFLDASPTSWHAVKEMGDRLAFKEFQPLDEKKKWKLEAGKSYFVTRGGALCAFCLPKEPPLQAILLASHTDSPALKLKPHPLPRQGNLVQYSTEVYGAPLLTSWLNRDLCLAGRVVVKTEEGIEERLVCIDDALLFIPQLAIHLDREVNDKGLLLNKQDHLKPVLGLSSAVSEGQDAVEMLLRRHISFHTLLSFELFLVPCESARFIGVNNEMLASYRLDNLISAHAALCAMGSISTPSKGHLRMAFFLDHEEVGSGSCEGASSPFMSTLLDRVLECTPEERHVIKAKSLCVSIDMAHALNPNYLNKHDLEHTPLLGKGVVLKTNANQKCASSAPSSAIVVQACLDLHLPLQSYLCRSDTPCGSTVGPLVAQEMGMATVDIGCPQLSMHSIREVLATQDYLDLTRLLSHLVTGMV